MTVIHELKRMKNKGIGLLELMLSLAIIAILLIMAVRYYQSASSSQQISSGADMVNAIRSAMKNFYNDNAGNSFATTQTVSISSLIDAGYLPPSFTVNPWNGPIGISTGSDSCAATTSITPTTTYKVCMNAVPVKLCSQLAIKLQGTMNGDLGESASCSGGAGKNLIATYSYG